MKIVGSVVVALAILGALWGGLTWLGDGRAPTEPGWSTVMMSKLEQWIGFGEGLAEDKLPDPGTLNLPRLESGQDSPVRPPAIEAPVDAPLAPPDVPAPAN